MSRAWKSWGALAPEQRLAALCAGGLFLTMFLPWYTRDTTAVVKGRLQTISTTLMAWKAFSFVEAAILLVAIGVLVLLFARGERRAFHLPGGDGLVIFAAGTWVALLVFYRLIDNKTGSTSEFQKVDYGVSWGIFVTLLCGVALAYAGQRLRQAHVAEPPLPGEAPTVADRRSSRRERSPRRDPFGTAADAPATRRDAPTAATSVAPAPRREEDGSDRPDIDGGTQLSFDEQE
jgi:hypothetical protein